MLVMKFGGTSVSEESSVLAICQLVKDKFVQKPIVVVSALSKVTDKLVQLCNFANFQNVDAILANIYGQHQTLGNSLLHPDKLSHALSFIESNLLEIKEQLTQFYKSGATVASLALQDTIVSYGEKMSSFLIATIIHEQTQIETRQILSSSCIVTNKKFGSSDYIKTLTRQNSRRILLPLVKKQIVPVVTGFIGSTRDGEITTLGRGGSDYSASILAASLDAKEIQIWTDVDGVYSADPRLVKSARLLPLLSYEEASELANLGAKVLHPRTIKPAIAAKIPVKVLNTFNPDSSGTTIVPKINEIKHHVKAITTRTSVPLITIRSNDMLFGHGFLKKIFTIFAHYNISVSLLSVSEVSVSITLDNIENLDSVLAHLNKLGAVTYENNYGSLSLVGGQIMETPHIMKDIATILERANIKMHMLSYSASNINVSMVLLSQEVDKALGLFHAHFIQDYTSGKTLQ